MVTIWTGHRGREDGASASVQFAVHSEGLRTEMTKSQCESGLTYFQCQLFLPDEETLNEGVQIQNGQPVKGQLDAGQLDH